VKRRGTGRGSVRVREMESGVKVERVWRKTGRRLEEEWTNTVGRPAKAFKLECGCHQSRTAFIGYGRQGKPAISVNLKSHQMKNYNTLSEATNDLKKRGYTNDLNLKSSCIECPAHNLQLHPEDFIIDEFYRFEGMSNPSDNSIVYAISSRHGIRGVLVDAYGMYSESLSPAMVKKLKIQR
jgi:hypothetical protein